MTSKFLPLCLLLAALALPARAQQVPVIEKTLSNGMRLLLLPRHDEPTVAGGWVAHVVKCFELCSVLNDNCIAISAMAASDCNCASTSGMNWRSHRSAKVHTFMHLRVAQKGMAAHTEA